MQTDMTKQIDTFCNCVNIQKNNTVCFLNTFVLASHTTTLDFYQNKMENLLSRIPFIAVFRDIIKS